MDNKKIDNLLTLRDKNYSGLARYLGRFRQSISKTKTTGKWTGDDLIKIAEYTNTNLAYIDKDGSIITVFDKNDLN